MLITYLILFTVIHISHHTLNGNNKYTKTPANTVHKRSRIRVCTTPSHGICQYCDCYEGNCNISTNERKVNYFYHGLLVSRKDLQNMYTAGTRHSQVGIIKKYRPIISYSFRSSSRQCCET